MMFYETVLWQHANMYRAQPGAAKTLPQAWRQLNKPAKLEQIRSLIAGYAATYKDFPKIPDGLRE